VVARWLPHGSIVAEAIGRDSGARAVHGPPHRSHPSVNAMNSRFHRGSIPAFLRPTRRPWLIATARHLVAWILRCCERRRQRAALADLDDRLLRDIGVARDAARREAATPFWRDGTLCEALDRVANEAANSPPSNRRSGAP
jgi:uncharacterized protein YjiS (DUF1127 family)